MKSFLIDVASVGVSLMLVASPLSAAGGDELDRLRAYLDRVPIEQGVRNRDMLIQYVWRLDAPRLRSLAGELGLRFPRPPAEQVAAGELEVDRKQLERFRRHVVDRLERAVLR